MLKVAAMVLGILGSIATFYFGTFGMFVIGAPALILWFGILLFWAFSVVALIGAILTHSNPKAGLVLLCAASAICILGTVGAVLSISLDGMLSFGPCALLLGLATVFAFIHYRQVQSGPTNHRRSIKVR